MKRIINTLTTVLIAMVILLLLALNVTKLFGITPYVVTSGSMQAVYPVGSLIYVKDVEPEDVSIGDAITFIKDDEHIATHQVYEIDEAAKQFRTQGVSNLDENGEIIHDATPVDYEALIGKPILGVPLLGYVNLFLAQRTGQFITIGAVAIMIIVSMIVDKEKEKIS